MSKIQLKEKLATFSEPWQPRVVGQFNGHDLMVAKLHGEFVWHKHDATDDFFMVLHGQLTIRLRDGGGSEGSDDGGGERSVTLRPGEIFVVPRGVEHCPVAEEEAHVLLIEATGTPNTGNPETAAPRREI